MTCRRRPFALLRSTYTSLTERWVALTIRRTVTTCASPTIVPAAHVLANEFSAEWPSGVYAKIEAFVAEQVEGVHK